MAEHSTDELNENPKFVDVLSDSVEDDVSFYESTVVRFIQPKSFIIITNEDGTVTVHDMEEAND